jgi:hypothetical protein
LKVSAKSTTSRPVSGPTLVSFGANTSPRQRGKGRRAVRPSIISLSLAKPGI